jgi:hypothetical protein
LELRVGFFAEGDRKLAESRRVLAAEWKDDKGRKTIPHLAAEKAGDTRIAPYSEVTERFGIPEGTRLINYRLIYKQLDEESAKRLGVKDPFFTKKYVLKNGVIEP